MIHKAVAAAAAIAALVNEATGQPSYRIVKSVDPQFKKKKKIRKLSKQSKRRNRR